MLKLIKRLCITAVVLFVAVVNIYWFNLDTKLVKLLEKPLIQHYDNMERKDVLTNSPYEIFKYAKENGEY